MYIFIIYRLVLIVVDLIRLNLELSVELMLLASTFVYIFIVFVLGTVPNYLHHHNSCYILIVGS